MTPKIIFRSDRFILEDGTEIPCPHQFKVARHDNYEAVGYEVSIVVGKKTIGFRICPTQETQPKHIAARLKDCLFTLKRKAGIND